MITDQFLELIKEANWEVKWLIDPNDHDYVLNTDYDSVETSKLSHKNMIAKVKLKELNIPCFVVYRHGIYDMDNADSDWVHSIFKLHLTNEIKDELIFLLQQEADRRMDEFWHNFIVENYKDLELRGVLK
jgi:hypothetical protein